MSISGGNISGGSDESVSSLLAIIADPATFQAKLKELREAKDQLDKAKAQAGLIGDVIAIKSQFVSLVESAKQNEVTESARRAQITKQAQEQANEVVRKAQEIASAHANQAGKVVERAQSERDKLAAEADELRKQVSVSAAAVQALKSKQDELDAREKKLAENEALVGKRLSSIDKIVEEAKAAIASI